jgi:mutator protein MutT
MSAEQETARIGVVPPKKVRGAIAVIFHPETGKLLICRRKADTVLGGYWEFPGGKIHPNETPVECALREVWEETGLTVKAVKELPLIEHIYPHAHVRLHPFLCEWRAGEVQLLAVAEAKWIDAGEVTQYRFPEANVKLTEEVARGYAALMA